jgi:hypothetical protein
MAVARNLPEPLFFSILQEGLFCGLDFAREFRVP